MSAVEAPLDIDERVHLPVAVPLYVKVAFYKAVPKGDRSKVLSKLICQHLRIPELAKDVTS